MKPANQIVKAGILLVAYVSVAVVPVAEVPIAVVLVADVPLAVVPVADVLMVAVVPVANISVAVVPVADVLMVAVVPVANIPLAVIPVAEVPAAGRRDFFVAKIPPSFYKTAKLAERISSEYPDIFIAHYVSMVINFKCNFIV